MSALENKDVTSAEKFFKKSINEISDVPSLIELSNIYISENTISGRHKARNLLEKGKWIEPNNIKLRLTYAALMENYSEGLAFDEYKKIVKIDSTCAAAWYNMGRITALDFYDYHNSVRREDEVDISFDHFAHEDFREAERYFLNSLRYDSLNADAYLKLSFLYEDAGKLDKGIKVLEKLVKIKPDNSNAHLYLGLLYYKISQISKSYSEYQSALLMMPLSERLDFTYNSVVNLLDPVAEELIKSMKPLEVRKFIDAFWNYSDPLYLTSYNERLLEHYSRVAYANLRFSLPGKPGWKTDRGEIVLRYGEPLKRTRYRPQINAGGRTEVKEKTDVWEYKDMIFGFEDINMAGNFVFAEPFPGSRYIPQFEGDSRDFADYARRVRFETYSPKYEGPVFTTPFNIVQFKNLRKSNYTDVYVNYALNFENNSVKNNLVHYKYEWGLFFTDDYLNPIYRDKGYVNDLSLTNIIATDSNKFLINSAEMSVKPDSGRLAFEIIRTADKGVSSKHENFRAEKFSNNNLDISNVLLAEKVAKDTESPYPLKRGKISLLPNPTSEFSDKYDLFLYYEIYNLALSHEGYTDFEQRITIQRTDEKSGLEKTLNSILGFIGLKKKDETITLSSRYQTPEKNSQMYIQLDMNKSRPGKYIIFVNVFDNISKREAASSCFLKWKN